MNTKNAKNTQLTATEDYNANNMIFSDVKTTPIPGKGKMTYKRINIQTKNPDKTVGDLVFQSPKLFCFGIKQFSGEDSGQSDGRAMSLCLWGKEGATEEETAFSDTLERVIAKCKKHLLLHKEEIDPDLHEAHLNKFSPIFRKKIGTKPDPDKSPVLSLKLVENKDKTKILTSFWDPQGNTVDPSSLQDQFCYVVGEICVESIYIGGGKFRLQVKLRHAEVEIVGNNKAPLLKRPKAITQVLDGTEDESNSLMLSDKKLSKVGNKLKSKLKSKFKKEDEKHDEDETGSINGDDGNDGTDEKENKDNDDENDENAGSARKSKVTKDEEDDEESPKPKRITKVGLKGKLHKKNV